LQRQEVIEEVNGNVGADDAGGSSMKRVEHGWSSTRPDVSANPALRRLPARRPRLAPSQPTVEAARSALPSRDRQRPK
jgi:hypothetical protein